MALTNILYPITEPIADFYTKIKAAITALKTFEGGATGQIIKKNSSTDYDVSWFSNNADGITETTGSIVVKLKIINIGTWDMDTNGSVTVAHGVGDKDKVFPLKVKITSDSNAVNDLTSVDSGTGQVSGSVTVVDDTNITLVRSVSGAFDNASYNGVGNRGTVLIAYTL